MFTLQTKLSIAKAILTKKSPYYVQFYINSRCNLKCKQCNIVESNSDVDDASLEDIEMIAKNIRKIGGGIVLLTGGEPFLRKDLAEIVKIFTRNKLDVRLQTAGRKLATRERLQECYDAGGRDINISFDSLDPGKQDYINSVPGSADNALKTISVVSEVFKDSGICSFGTVLSRFNYAEIPHLLKFATAIGWYMSLVPVHITDTEDPMGFRSYEDDFRFREEEWPELEATMEELIKMRRDGYRLFDAESFLRSSVNFIKTGRPTWRKNNVCDSPFLYFAIRPNGDFATCCDYKFPGKPVSLVDPDFPKIYKSKEFVDRALSLTKPCNGCHYGSCPEVTLSVRDPKALLERISIVRKSSRTKINPMPYEKMKEMIEEIRAGAPHIYDKSKNPDKYNNRIIMDWETKEGRKRLTAEDNAKRAREGRIRQTAQSRHAKQRELETS